MKNPSCINFIIPDPPKGFIAKSEEIDYNIPTVEEYIKGLLFEIKRLKKELKCKENELEEREQTLMDIGWSNNRMGM